MGFEAEGINNLWPLVKSLDTMCGVQTFELILSYRIYYH